MHAPDRGGKEQLALRGARVLEGTGGCFAAGTPIATPDSEKPIEEVKAGDTVRTADPATGAQSYGKVVRTFVGEVEKILEVETADGARVKATEGHPFFVEGRGFIEARKLARGDLLRRVDGRRTAVVGLGWEEARTRVYNFEVEGTHTYYAGGVWVHNARPCESAGPKGGVYLLRDPETGLVVRPGRTKNLAVRKAQPGRGEDTRSFDFEVVYSTDDYAEQRGLEEIVHSRFPEASLNQLRAIYPTNPNRQAYLDAAEAFLEAVGE